MVRSKFRELGMVRSSFRELGMVRRVNAVGIAVRAWVRALESVLAKARQPQLSQVQALE
jgi:hypothetical protein